MCKQPLYFYSLNMGLHNIRKLRYLEYYIGLKCNQQYRMKFGLGGMGSLVSSRYIICSHQLQNYPGMLNKKDHKVSRFFISYHLLLNLSHKPVYMLLSRSCKITSKKGRHLSSSKFYRLISSLHLAHCNFNKDSHNQIKTSARIDQFYPK